jgi:enoyl-CoA hydratase/carnithine racemase
MAELVRMETGHRPGVATLRLDRPKLNAFNQQVTDELNEVVAELASRDDIRAVVVWGGPDVFAAGADIKRFQDLSPADAERFSGEVNAAMLAIENLPQITIAAVNGYALGGGMELAMATDFRMAADDATFGQPEIQLGVIPGGGGTQRLPRLVGVTRAKEIVYSGRNVSATEALEIGLVSSLHPAEEVHEAALSAAAGYAAGPAALRMAKRSIMDGLALPLDEAVAQESARFGECFDTDDCRIGVASFFENGPGRATFTGR